MRTRNDNLEILARYFGSYAEEKAEGFSDETLTDFADFVMAIPNRMFNFPEEDGRGIHADWIEGSNGERCGEEVQVYDCNAIPPLSVKVYLNRSWEVSLRNDVQVDNTPLVNFKSDHVTYAPTDTNHDSIKAVAIRLINAVDDVWS